MLCDVSPRHRTYRGGVERSRSEPELIERARSGSTEAFSQLVRMHQAAVRAYAARYLHGRHAIDDLAQEVFVDAHRGLGGYRGDAPFRLWLLAISRRHVADHLRDEMRRRARESNDLEGALLRWQAEHNDGEEAGLARHDAELAALSQCLEGLSGDSAAMVKSHYFQSETAVDMAERLGKKESAVRMALLRIRQALRTCVERRLASGNA